jgi:hypothetical protein
VGTPTFFGPCRHRLAIRVRPYYLHEAAIMERAVGFSDSQANAYGLREEVVNVRD